MSFLRLFILLFYTCILHCRVQNQIFCIKNYKTKVHYKILRVGKISECTIRCVNEYHEYWIYIPLKVDIKMTHNQN